MLAPKSLVVLVVVFAAAAEAQLSETNPCYPGWVYALGSCYGFGEDDVSWAGASALCRIFDGTLAEIETQAENDFLKGYARNHSYVNLWIGGTDIFTEGIWLWSASKNEITSESFNDWASGEPNHAGGASNEDCMELYSHKGYQWNDEDCRQNNRFVCEISL